MSQITLPKSDAAAVYYKEPYICVGSTAISTNHLKFYNVVSDTKVKLWFQSPDIHISYQVMLESIEKTIGFITVLFENKIGVNKEPDNPQDYEYSSRIIYQLPLKPTESDSPRPLDLSLPATEEPVRFVKGPRTFDEALREMNARIETLPLDMELFRP